MADFQIENGVLVKYTGAGGDVTVPEGVTSIGDFAFSECESIVSVVLPEGLTSIGSYAFLACDNLERIAIPQSVTFIGSGAFKSCYSLEAVTLPKHITAISDDTFWTCLNLANISIPESVTSIGSKAFCGCWKFTSIAIPEGVTAIGKGTFSGCHSLTSVTIPGSVTSIGDGAFENCEHLTSVTIPGSVTSIGSGAFKNCEHLTSVTIPEGVRSIGSRAFSECKSLVSVTLPQSLTAIGDNAFEWCRLAGIVIPDNVTSFGRRVFLNYTCPLVVSLPKAAERVLPFFLGGECFKTGVILRSGGKYEYIAFSAWAASHNLSALTARESGWAPYDTQLISNGPRFKYTLSARLLGALGRLYDPEGLTEKNREMLLDILSKNILKLVPLAELVRCPEMIQAAVETGAVNASNRKALRKLLSASPIPEISALATQKLTASAPEQKKKDKPASPLAAEYTRKLKEINGENLLKNMRSIEARMPIVLLKDGTPAPEALFLYILVSYCAQYSDGFCEFVPEADAAAELLQYDSLCEAMDVVSDHLNVIIYPTLLPLLCRFGTPVQIQRMIDSAQDWQRLGKKGQKAEKALREAMNLSDTRAAVLWLHAQNRLKRYAELRNIPVEAVRERYALS